MKTILDLCGGTGSWSWPYNQAGYDVRVLSLPVDVRLVERKDLPAKAHGILCAPPCTVFSAAGARWKRSEEEMLKGISVMDACLRICTITEPEFWALENPVGKMRRYLGDPRLIFNPCDYGDPYTKRTLLWGDFKVPERSPVEATEGSKMHLKYGGKSDKTKTLRSQTPAGFAKAFFEANP